jgi:short-subunit dehydrogenase
MDFTSKLHLDSYPALAPTRAELSQAGRTVFITGGSGGVGLAIGRSFAEAGVTRLVLVARRAAILAEAKDELEKLSCSKIEILVYSCDVGDLASVRNVWDDLKAKSIDVDVLVLNAAAASTLPQGMAEENLVSKIWSTFEINVLSALQMADIFLKQGPSMGKVRETRVPLFKPKSQG